MDTKTAQEYIDRAADGEIVEVQAGVRLLSRAEMQDAADSWSDDDPARALDYSSSPYWLIMDDGADPIQMCDAEDLADAIN